MIAEKNFSFLLGGVETNLTADIAVLAFCHIYHT